MLPKLLACVCFHYSDYKFHHLCGVVENLLSNYPEADIIVDTNSRHSRETIQGKFRAEQRVRVFVHEGLSHPFHLAWVHRVHFRREIDYYGAFMYIEDDIFVPRDNYLNYLEVFGLMWPRFMPSFVRTEEKDGVLYCADAFIRTRIGRHEVLEIGGRRFITLDNPYHAFWAMPRDALKASMNEDFERIHEGGKLVREIAASYGLAPGKRPCVRWDSYDVQKRGLVEVDGRMQVSPLCRVKHTTNKYINDRGFNFGKIRVDRLIKKDAIML